MIGMIGDFQIGNVVIEFITVSMMNDLGVLERTIKMQGHD